MHGRGGYTCAKTCVYPYRHTNEQRTCLHSYGLYGYGSYGYGLSGYGLYGYGLYSYGT